MTENPDVLLREPEAHRWLEASFYAFWRRHQNALDAEDPYRPGGLEEEADRFRRFGQELQVLEWDLTECLNEFRTAYRLLYRDKKDLALKKFSIVYHTDNFYVRVHKLIEDIYALLALTVGLDPKRKPRAGTLSRRQQVWQVLNQPGLGTIASSLRGFENHRLVKRAVEARNMFVHLYREEPQHEWRWAMLAPVSRLQEFTEDPDEIEAELRRVSEPEHLDDYADQKMDQLSEALGVIREFRDKLYDVLLNDVVALLEARPEEGRKRFRGLLDWAQFWRSLGEKGRG